MAAEAAFDLQGDERARVLALRGDWTVDTIAVLDADLRAIEPQLQAGAVVDVGKLGRIDTAGAFLIDRTLRAGAGPKARIAVRGEHPFAKRLLEMARGAAKAEEDKVRPPWRFSDLLEKVGRNVGALGEEIIQTVSFFGETLVVLARLIVNPRRIRWVSVVHVMEHAGLNALPIVAMLSFFIGLVVAYLGARILGDFGASVFTVELVAFSMMREFGVVITAVLLAGRTNSAFTAEIGAMKMRQEIDAMRVIGIDPMEALVAPRVIALLVMLPILTFVAIMAGLFGGLLVTVFELDVSSAMFWTRISDAVPEQHFWVGMSKAPVFALALAVIACKQGLSVGGDVGSLGRRTTTSVVQAIFMVILLDALFALWFLEMDL
ncbi:MAG: MlaE family lipid ABC transporter permease subunit [Hyphomonadaceae bacterium]